MAEPGSSEGLGSTPIGLGETPQPKAVPQSTIVRHGRLDTLRRWVHAGNRVGATPPVVGSAPNTPAPEGSK
jgi:hypothetical protein